MQHPCLGLVGLSLGLGLSLSLRLVTIALALLVVHAQVHPVLSQSISISQVFTQVYGQPVVGVLTFPVHLTTDAVPPGNWHSFIDGSYVKWLEQGGARVVSTREG